MEHCSCTSNKSSRIKVTNIVPGNSRRRLSRGMSTADDSGLDIDFQIAEEDLCEKVNCGKHGECRKSGTCECYDSWFGEVCDVNPCVNVTACGDHGECTATSAETFECSCDSSWGGKYCDVYSVIVEIPVSNATNATNGTQAPTTSAPTTSAPTQSPTLSPTYASNATNTTSEEVNTFSDLINTASIFIEKLSTGKLDVGYEAKGVAMSFRQLQTPVV